MSRHHLPIYDGSGTTSCATLQLAIKIGSGVHGSLQLFDKLLRERCVVLKLITRRDTPTMRPGTSRTWYQNGPNIVILSGGMTMQSS